MATFNVAAASGALKDLFLPPVREQLNTSNWVLMQFEKNTEDFEGERGVLSVHVGRNAAVGFRADGGTLPVADYQKYVKSYISMRYSYAIISVSRPAIKTMKSNRGSFIRAVKPEMDGAMKDLKRDWSRALLGTGDGVLASTEVSTATNDVILDAATPRGVLRALEEGARIDIGTVASPTTIASNRTVTAVNYTTKTITISGAVVTTNGTTHRIFREGSGGDGIETVGLQQIISDADDNFQSVDTGLYPVWKAASVVDANQATLTDTLLEELLDEIDIVSGESEGLIAATTHGVLRNYAATLKDNKRFVNTTTLKGGFSAVTVDTPAGQLSIKRDRDVPDGEFFCFNPKHIQLFELADWEFVDEDGSVLQRSATTDGFEARLAGYKNLATDRRNAHGRITDLLD